MRDSPFFKEIEHNEIVWGDNVINAPMFFYDAMNLTVYLLASIEKVKAILPSTRMKPYRVTPWHCIVSITAFEFRDCDIGPYNEVSISVPFTFDRNSPLFTGILRKAPEVSKIYIHKMPVTTEISRDAGIRFAGYPKFLADIKFAVEGEWISCKLSLEGKSVLKITGRQLKLTTAARHYVNPITFRNGHLLRSELVISERKAGISKDSSDVQLELGSHPIAKELRDINLGRVLAYQYCPHFQSVLSPVYESFSADENDIP